MKIGKSVETIFIVSMSVCSLFSLYGMIQYEISYAGMSMIPPLIENTPYAYSHTFAIAFIILAIAFLSFELGGRVK